MKFNHVKADLKIGKTIFGTMAFEFFTPGLCQILHSAGASFVILDMEHSGVSIDTIKTQISYARGLVSFPWYVYRRHNITLFQPFSMRELWV